MCKIRRGDHAARCIGPRHVAYRTVAARRRAAGRIAASNITNWQVIRMKCNVFLECTAEIHDFEQRLHPDVKPRWRAVDFLKYYCCERPMR